MRNTGKLILQVIVFAAVMICLGVAIKQLIASGRYSNPQLTALQTATLKNSLLEIEKQKQEVILTALAADKAEQALREERAIRRKMAVASQERLWGAFWFGLVVSLFAGAFVACVGLAGGLVKIFWIHGDIIAGGLVRKALPLETRLEIEQAKIMREALKLQGRAGRERLPEAIDVTPEAEQTRIQTRFDGPEALTLRVPDSILIGKSIDGQPYHKSLKELRAIGVMGDPGQGKSNTMAWIAAQVRCNGGLLYVLDLHGAHEESITQRLGAVRLLPGVSLCSDGQDVPGFLASIIAMLDKRLRSKSAGDLPDVLVVISEIIALSDDFPTVTGVQKRIVNEGRKAHVYSAVDAQVWTAENVKSTAVRDTLETFICHRADPQQARAFLKRKPADLESLQVGEALVRQPGKGQAYCQIPFLTLADMDALATQAKPIRAEYLPGKPAEDVIDFQPVKKDNVTPIFRHGWS